MELGSSLKCPRPYGHPEKVRAPRALPVCDRLQRSRWNKPTGTVGRGASFRERIQLEGHGQYLAGQGAKECSLVGPGRALPCRRLQETALQ